MDFIGYNIPEIPATQKTQTIGEQAWRIVNVADCSRAMAGAC